MAEEIERKFLVNNFPVDLVQHSESQRVNQGYLFHEKHAELRVRQKGNRFFLTKKSGSGLVRDEEELEISEEVFNLLWPFTHGKRINKVRYSIDIEGKTVEIDDFSGDLEPLTILEVEFNSEQLAHAYTPPKFVEREITEDSRYKNANLALNGKPA